MKIVELSSVSGSHEAFRNSIDIKIECQRLMPAHPLRKANPDAIYSASFGKVSATGNDVADVLRNLADAMDAAHEVTP